MPMDLNFEEQIYFEVCFCNGRPICECVFSSALLARKFFFNPKSDFADTFSETSWGVSAG